MKRQHRAFVFTELLMLFFIALQFLYLPALVPHPSVPAPEAQCAFCSEHVIAKQQYYESSYFRVLYNYEAILPGQSLGLPKRHIKMWEELTTEELVDMYQVMQRVQGAFLDVYGTDEYLMCCQNGANAGQTVAHMHLHMIPRLEKNLWTKLQLWAAMLGRPLVLYSPLTEEQLQDRIAPLAEACAKADQGGNRELFD